MKEPTAWMDDLNVYLDDESMSSLAAQQAPTATFAGSRVGVGLWTAIVGTTGGALGGVMLSPDIRSALGVVAWLLGAFLLLRGVRPVTDRIFGKGVAWIARSALLWGFLMGPATAIGGRVQSTTLGYGIAMTAGFFIGWLAGAVSPTFIKHEYGWMVFSLLVAPAAMMLGTALLRGPYARSGAAEAMLASGAFSAAGYMVAIYTLMVVLWDRAQGLYRTALLFLHNDNFATRAVDYLDRAIALSPDDPRLYNLRGIAWSKLGRSDAARADWAKVSELLPNDPDPLINLGADYMKNDMVDQAIATYERMLQRYPDNARGHSNLGSALERTGDLDGAIHHYDRAIEIQPGYAAAFSNRSYAHHRKGDHARALADADEAIRLNERLAMAYVNRGHALAALGRVEDAIGSYRAVVMLEPDPKVRQEAMQGIERLESSAPGRDPNADLP